MNTQDLTAEQLKRAATIKEQINDLNEELVSMLGGSNNSSTLSTKNRTMSADIRRKIAAAQKTRWAKLRHAKSGKHSAKPAAKKTVSSATRRKLAAKLKAYWAAKRAGKK